MCSEVGRNGKVAIEEGRSDMLLSSLKLVNVRVSSGGGSAGHDIAMSRLQLLNNRAMSIDIRLDRGTKDEEAKKGKGSLLPGLWQGKASPIG